MDTTGWYLKDTAHPERVLHAHPLHIVQTETEAMDKRISRWHYANGTHDDPTLHAYYNSFNPDSTRWAPSNKGDAYRRIVANMTTAQRRQVILNAQASHNAGGANPEPHSPFQPHPSDTPPPSDDTPDNVPSIPQDDRSQHNGQSANPAPVQNGSPNPDQLQALTALIEEQAKMSALGLRANVETRNSLNGYIANTDAGLAAVRESLTRTDARTAEQAEQTSQLLTRMAELESQKAREVIITIKRPGQPDEQIKTGRHQVFGKVLEYATHLAPGRNGIWLTGGAGTGKTTLAMHIAEATGREFRLQGAITAKHDLLGYMDGNGKYVGTPFRDAYENGHLLLLDEIDASFPAGTLAIQASISNKVCQFPDSKSPVQMHPNFIVFCAANTTGQGSDALYSGRTKQDAAFLDRFMKVHVDYDENWERSVTPAHMMDWTKAVQKVRANVSSAHRTRTGVQGAGAQIIVSIRSIFQGIDLIPNVSISAVEIVDDIFRTPYGNVNTFDTLFAPVYEYAREYDRKRAEQNRGES